MRRLGVLIGLVTVLFTASCSQSGGAVSGGAGSGGGGGTGSGGAGSGGAGSGGDASVPDLGGQPNDGGGDTQRDSVVAGDVAADGPATGELDCTGSAKTSLFCAPLGALPASIKDTGLFPNAPDLSLHLGKVVDYVPTPELWSDGMGKSRFMIFPPGKKVDNSNRAQWTFPVGTISVKTFFDDGGAGGKPRPIETRLIRAAKDVPYEFFVYQWNASATDATLVLDDIAGDINADVSVPVTINRQVDGKPFTINGGNPFMHVLPSRNACGSCHEQNAMAAQMFIGFDELRLNSKLTLGSAKTQLQELSDAGLFTAPVPGSPATIVDNTVNDGGRLLRIKRWAFGNCVHCHNGGGQVDLRPDVFVANTVSRPTEAQSVRPPAGWLRVVPGMPARSVLYVQVQRTMLPPPTGGGAMNRLRAMPPVGVADLAADQTAVKDLFDWISALPAR